MPDALSSDGLTPSPARPKARRMDVRSPELSLFDFPLRKAAEAKRDAEFVAPVLATPTADLRGMVRGEGSIESQRAAVDVLKRDCEWLRQRLLEIAATDGPFTAREAEERDEFTRVGFSKNTVRRRITDLVQAAQRGRPGLVKVGRRDKMGVWGIAGSSDAR